MVDKRQGFLWMAILVSIFVILNFTSLVYGEETCNLDNCHVINGTGTNAPWINDTVFTDPTRIHYNISGNLTASGANLRDDCKLCHLPPDYDDTDPVAGYRMPPRYLNDTRIYPYSCTDCHVAVAGTGSPPRDVGAPLVFNTTTPCENCHNRTLISAYEPWRNYTGPVSGFTWDNGSKNNIANVSHYGTNQTCRSCHFATTYSAQLAQYRNPSEDAFSESKHDGSRDCAELCHPRNEMHNASNVSARYCGNNNACHNLTSSYAGETFNKANHSKKGIGCENCHGPSHEVGTFKRACEVCHPDKEKHRPALDRLHPEQAALNQTFRCALCHYDFHSTKLTKPSCETCHDKDKLPDTGEVCEKCHNKLHRNPSHANTTIVRCTDCHSFFHDNPRRVDCQKCHTQVRKERIDQVIDPHANCKTCHKHYRKPMPVLEERISFCSNCHEETEAGRFHKSEKLSTDIHTEVSKARMECEYCHEEGTDKMPTCILCHNVHRGKHEINATCIGCHGLLVGERTHFRLSCFDGTCHNVIGDKGAALTNLIPENVSIGVTKPTDCEFCHNYKRKTHRTCSRCHGEQAPKGTDLASFNFMSTGTVIYGKDSFDIDNANYLREGTALKIDTRPILEIEEKFKPLYDRILLSWYNPLPFSSADNRDLNVTPILAIENLSVGKITNDTGRQHIVYEVKFPDIKMRPVIEKNLVVLNEVDMDDAVVYTNGIKLQLYDDTAVDYLSDNLTDRGVLYIISDDAIEGSLNLDDSSNYENNAINDDGLTYDRDPGNDISNAVHTASDALDGYDVYVTDATAGSIAIAIANRNESIVISDEQENVWGYTKIAIDQTSNDVELNGTTVTFVDREMQKVTPKYEYSIIVGGPVGNPLAARENGNAGITFNVTENKTDLIIENETYTFESGMWKKEDFAILKIREGGENSLIVYAEGCTRYGTEAAVKIFKESSSSLSGKTTAMIHWKDLNGNEAVELKEIEIFHAF